MNYKNACLLVIDIQVGSFTIDNSHIENTEVFLSRVSELVAAARSNNIPVVFSQFSGPPETDMAPGGPGHEIHEIVAPLPGEIVVMKTHSDVFFKSNLKCELDKMNIQTLIVCGLQTEFCIDSTCRSAHNLGYSVILVEDAHATSDSAVLTAQAIIDHHNLTLGRAFVSTIKTRAVVEDVELV